MAKRKDILEKYWPRIINMATIEERLTAVLEQVVALQNDTRSIPPHKEILYIPEFCGDPHKLTQFLSIVETHLKGTAEDRKPIIWTAITNLKITGKAKELMINNGVTTWEAAKHLLTQHFRPIIDIKDIIRKINGIKVSSVLELCQKLEDIISQINTYSLYEINRDEIKNMLYQTVMAKIKDLVKGSLARELRTVFDIHQTKEILFSYVGFDENLEIRHHPNHPKNNHPFKPKPNPPPNPSTPFERQQNPQIEKNRRFGSDRFRQHSSHSDSSRPQNNHNHPFNPSGQFRNSPQNPQPMEVDNIHTEETNNNIEEQVFLN